MTKTDTTSAAPTARVRFEPDGLEVDVPIGTTIRAAAEQAGAPLGSACGGVCACSTCHVYVSQGRAALSSLEDKEEDRLDGAFDVRPSSRLACQARLSEPGPFRVEITRESRQAFWDEHPDLAK
ncbi:MAG: 2Fe-2S iron-sulfur cluster-binding protein [Polyangia bacterium]|jgi:2Fe-2S ferredoxin